MRRRPDAAAAAYGLAAVQARSRLVADERGRCASPARPTVAMRAAAARGRGGGVTASRPGDAPAMAPTSRVLEALPPAVRSTGPRGRGPGGRTRAAPASTSPIRGGHAPGCTSRRTSSTASSVEPCRSSYVPASPGDPVRVRPARAPTPTALADAIADLPRADVVVSPHLVARWGTTAVHVRVRVPHARLPQRQPACGPSTPARGGEFLGNASATARLLGRRASAVRAARGRGRSSRCGATAAERRALTAARSTPSSSHARESQ